MLRNIIINDWFTVSIVVCLVFIAAAKLLFFNRFNDFIEIIGNSNYLKIYIKDQKFINTFDGLLFINLVISLTIFVILTINNLDGIEFYFAQADDTYAMISKRASNDLNLPIAQAFDDAGSKLWGEEGIVVSNGNIAVQHVRISSEDSCFYTGWTTP